MDTINNRSAYILLNTMAQVYETHKQELSGYDAVIGDGDHGFSLARGNKAAKEAIAVLGETATVHELFKQYGRALTCELGGAMGPLFGLLFTQTGKACQQSSVLGLAELSAGMSSALELITELGGAKVGDKTMVDAITPTAEALRQATAEGKTFSQGLADAVAAADAGVKSTIPLQARRGRSKYMREKSIGYQDAGATSFYYFIKTIADHLLGGVC